MKLFRCCDGVRDELVIEAPSFRAAAERYIETESSGEQTATLRIDVRVAPIDLDAAARWIPVLLEPTEPQCKDPAPHIWRNLQMIVHDKGVYLREACLRCGIYRVTETGVGSLESVTPLSKSVAYEDADEESLANLNRAIDNRQADLFDRQQESQEHAGGECAANSNVDGDISPNPG